LNKIRASNEAVALDTVMAYVMGLGVDDVPYLRVARERGLGETELARIEIDGESRPVAGYKVPVPAETSFSYASGVAGGKTSLAFFRSRVNLRPRIDPLKCSQPCTLCTDKCPGGALEMSRMPRFKVDKCLGCFRCCEICPVGAISLLASE
ncbi:MAG: hypothetical protein M1609_16700, partial [Firmicutes bacterium]|nr:hypothetical protein [Bacillota bacterium]